jgi:hypothetical protein
MTIISVADKGSPKEDVCCRPRGSGLLQLQPIGGGRLLQAQRRQKKEGATESSYDSVPALYTIGMLLLTKTVCPERTILPYQ